MGGIRIGRVLAGGLVAGVISLVSGYTLGHVVLQGESQAVFERLGVVVTWRILVTVVGMRLGFGIGLVWLYAAIRPRFGPGPRTALVAGTAMWLFTWGFYTAAVNVMGLYSTSAILIGLAWSLVEAWLCALAGAAIYREA